MTIKLDLLRPDDLLSLTIEGENIKLDTSKPKEPALVLEEPRRPGYLIVTFPPQTIVEEAIFESSPTPPPSTPESPDKPKPENTLPYNSDNPLTSVPPPPVPPYPTLPVRSRIGGSSRLVFRIPAGSTVRIPYTTEGLLNWDQFDLNVTPLADVPPAPTQAERQGAPDITPPGPLDTAIELPYRLILSPNHSVAWQHAFKPKTTAGFTELWHTRLALKNSKGKVEEVSRANPAPLRAIWSPDYTPKDPPVFGKEDSDWPGVLTPMTASDRYEIVTLTSAFSGYVKDKDDFTPYIPQPIHAEQFILSALGGWLKSRGEWDPPAPFYPIIIFRPDHLKQWESVLNDVAKLATIEGTIIHPPAAGLLDAIAETQAGKAISAASETKTIVTRPRPVLPTEVARGIGSILYPPLLGFTGNLLNLSEWTHIATLGRDHYVRIVYEGHLYPFGHRAALIKITERKIRDVPLKDGSTVPVAYLVQRMFIVVRQPLRDYTDSETRSQLENNGRGLPFKSIRLTTLVTPDIADPSGGPKIPKTTYSFWVRLGTGAKDTDDFKFHAVAEDIAGNPVDFTASLIFIPFGESMPGRQSVFKNYTISGEERAVAVPGEKVTFAPPVPGGANENTNLTTHALYFTSQPAPYDKKFGAFLPRLLKASVKLPAVEAILGISADTQIGYHDQYLKNQPGNLTGLFASIVNETAPGILEGAKLLSAFSADKGGGFATPNLSITGLTSQLGPMAGNLDKAANDVFNPADFFKDVKDAAKLFGSFSLADLLQPLTMTAGAPKVQINKEDLGAVPPKVKFKLVSTLDWTPEVQELSLEFAVFHPSKKGAPAKLEVHSRAEKVVELPPSGAADPGTASMDGTLTNFTVELLHVVEILFEKFAFSAGTGKKLDVTVALDSDEPVKFIDDLAFVDELRKNIPAGLFGDGPSLDINAMRVKAGFSLGLPPVAVGVFALKDVTIAAFIELPFLEGRPLFDFSFSSREHPFNLTVAFLGGGGFFHLQLDTLGVKLLEIALEFGASASIDLGVASGGVHIMAGIYFSLQRHTVKGLEVTGATLSGYLRMGGELSILGIISLSLEFYLAFGYESDGVKSYAFGRATLTVKVEVLFFSTSVEISVEKRFGGSGGDPVFLDTFNSPAIWTKYAGAFA